MFGCHFYTFDYIEWFNSEAEALECGKRSGFSFRIVAAELAPVHPVPHRPRILR